MGKHHVHANFRLGHMEGENPSDLSILYISTVWMHELIIYILLNQSKIKYIYPFEESTNML